jgi:hypothetical protein
MEACYGRLQGWSDGCQRQRELLGPPLSFRQPEIELTIRHKTIATAAQAFHVLEELALRPGRQTVFRGHREEGWRLTSTLHRQGGLLQTHSLDGALSHFIVNLKSVAPRAGSKADRTVHATSGVLELEDFSLAKGDTLTIDKSLQASFAQASDGQGGTMLTFRLRAHPLRRYPRLAAMASSSITWV